MSSKVDQRKAQADGDMVAGDKITYNQSTNKPKSVEALLGKLKEQIDNNQHAQDTITELARYHVRRSADGIDGLEKKLEAGELSHTFIDAIEKRNGLQNYWKPCRYTQVRKVFLLYFWLKWKTNLCMWSTQKYQINQSLKSIQ